MLTEEDFAVNLAGIKLEHPIMPAAGTCKSLKGEDGMVQLARSAASAIMVGSITIEPREGYSGETYWSNKDFSLNARGLPNQGILHYQQGLPIMLDVAQDSGKPLFVSVAGLDPDEYTELTELVLTKHGRQHPDCYIRLIELNLGCPNIWQNGLQKPPLCFDLNLVSSILQSIEKRVGPETKIAVKLAPFVSQFDDNLWAAIVLIAESIQQSLGPKTSVILKPVPYTVPALQEIAQIITQSKIVRAVTAINSLANVIIYKDKAKHKSLIDSPDGSASLAGPAILSLGLKQVKQLRQLLPPGIDIIGVGGIQNGKDVMDYLRAGAKAVQVATAFLNEGIKVFDRLLLEFVDEVEKGGKP